MNVCTFCRLSSHFVKLLCLCGAIVELRILCWNFVDCVDDEWIGNRHVGIGWGHEVVRGKTM